MRQYYDVLLLVESEEVKPFIGTQEYESHKLARFPAQDLSIPIAENEAFQLSDPEVRARYRKRYESTASLYYNGQPVFGDILGKIRENIDLL